MLVVVLLCVVVVEGTADVDGVLGVDGIALAEVATAAGLGAAFGSWVVVVVVTLAGSEAGGELPQATAAKTQRTEARVETFVMGKPSYGWRVAGITIRAAFT